MSGLFAAIVREPHEDSGTVVVKGRACGIDMSVTVLPANHGPVAVDDISCDHAEAAIKERADDFRCACRSCITVEKVADASMLRVLIEFEPPIMRSQKPSLEQRAVLNVAEALGAAFAEDQPFDLLSEDMLREHGLANSGFGVFDSDACRAFLAAAGVEVQIVTE